MSKAKTPSKKLGRKSKKQAAIAQRFQKLSQDWQTWQDYLRDRLQGSERSPSVNVGKHSWLLWAIPGVDSPRLEADWLQQLHKRACGQTLRGVDWSAKLQAWLDCQRTASEDVAFVMESLGWCSALPRLASELSQHEWMQCFETLCDLVDQADRIELSERPLLHQLLTVELATSLAFYLPELEQADSLLRSAVESASYALTELLDGEGILRGDHQQNLRPLLATWCRSIAMLNEIDSYQISAEARNQYSWLIQQSLRMSRPDGSHLLAECGGEQESGGSWTKPFLTLLLEHSGDKDDEYIADCVLNGRKTPHPRQPEDAPEATAYSEWAEVGVLRTGWTPEAIQFAVNFSQSDYSAELISAGKTLMAGTMMPEVKIDGDLLKPDSGWTEACWHNDDDGDYLETEIELANGWRIERQVFLARRDGFLYFADALLGEEQADVQYRLTLPVAQQFDCCPQDETREWTLKNGKSWGSLLPLAQPEWATQRSVGEIKLTGGGLEHSIRTKARRVYAPIFLDLNRRRNQKPLTWRQLTVGQKLELQSVEDVVGYRVQVGKDQFLIYRSLAPIANRTVLGQNLLSQFLVGRFHSDGSVDELIEIE